MTHNEMPKDTVEEQIKELVKLVTLRDETILKALTTAYNKGVEAERKRVLSKIDGMKTDPIGFAEKSWNMVIGSVLKVIAPLPDDKI